jgi:transcriptional regulator GlxA family with amidase domain
MPETAGIPLIFLTARAGTGDEIEGLSSGADQYLRKPFDAALLRAHVAAAFAAVQRLRRHFADSASAAAGSSPEDGGAASAAAPVPDAADRRFLAAAERWFDAALHDENAAIADLADALHVSHATLGRRYSRLTGETPAAALRRRRLERARDLLSRGEGNVSEVAYAVGYASLAAFSNAYRQHFGHPPSRTS